MNTVVLDSSGKLVGFLWVPPQIETTGAAAPDPDWNQMLAASGLDPASLKPVEPTWLPPTGFDRRFGWRGYYPEDPKTEMQISAASYRGKPVYFHVIGPWSQPWRMQTPQRSRSQTVRITTFIIGGFVTLILAALFARRNLRLGRGDRRGAFRISAFMFSTAALTGLLTAHHVPDLAAEWQVLIRITEAALFISSFVWLYYLALEPFVRRQWPELLISWTRLLSGHFRDPLIGRDLLVGILGGSIFAIGVHVANSLPGWYNLPGQTTIPTSPLAVSSAQDLIGYLLSTIVNGLFPAFAITFTLFLVRTLARNYWLSVLITGVVLLLTNLGGENFLLETPFVILGTVITMFVLLRFGILALAVSVFAADLLTSCPISFDFSQWYAPHTVFLACVLFAGLFYGVRVASGNKPLLERIISD